MLDYNGLLAAATATTSAFQEAQSEPLLAYAGEQLAWAAENEAAVFHLGVLLGPLLVQAGSEPTELDLLRRVAVLWRRGNELAQELETARIEFELSLARDDLPNALQVLQMGLDRLAGLHAPVKDLVAQIEAIKAEVDTLAHLAPHPRQADLPSSGWDWANLFAGRRGFAFVQAMREGGQDARGRAFAGGAIAGYAGHVGGSACLGAVVGGPRRLHRFRDRLARNTLGMALRRAVPVPSLGDLAAALRFEAREVPVLPPDLKAQLTSALIAAYPDRSIPDLDIAHRRMIEHLELLTGFVLPKPPGPPPIVPDPSPEPATIQTQTFGAPEGPDGPTIAMGPDTNHDSPGISSQKKAQGDNCLLAFLLIATVGIAYGLWCIGRLIADKKCGIEDFIGAASPEEPDPRAPQTNQQMLEKLREPANANHILDDIYQLQIRMWQGLTAARSFLTVCGLVPPNEEELVLPLFKQFLVPTADNVWPHREPMDAEDVYTDRPTTPAEDAAQPKPFPNKGCEWLLHVNLVDNESTFSEVVFAVLRGERVNLDLDADRGRLHPAWAVASGTSILDQPLTVSVLPFEEQ